MPLSHYQQGFRNGVAIRGMPVLNSYGGKVFWVDSNGSTNDNKGTFDRPFATVDAAIGACTASKGDMIFVKAGHSETLSAAIAADVAGIAIYGLGVGTNRPQFTGAVAADLLAVTAANVTISGLYFNEKTTASATSATIDIAAANCRVENCHFDCGANEVLGITVTAAGEIPEFVNNTFVVTANGPDNFIQIEGVVDQPLFAGNTFITSDGTNGLDDGYAVSFESVAVTNAVFEGNRVLGNGVVTNLLGGDASAVGTKMDGVGTLTGEADVDVSASDYTTVGGIALLTITPTTALSDLTIDMDFLKATTGLLVVNTTETVQIMIQSKIDGTNWRTIQHWPAASSTTGLAVPDAAQDLDALDDSPGKRFYVGNVDADGEVRVTIELSAETGGDAEIPYRITYRGDAPVVTAVAAA